VDYRYSILYPSGSWKIIDTNTAKVVTSVPSQYFSKRRGLANGIVYAGGGFGGAVNSFAMNALVQKLGPEWCFRIFGFMTLATGLPAAWLIRERAPLKTGIFIDWLVSMF
jgi:nitrate/nitrite transporter NarK